MNPNDPTSALRCGKRNSNDRCMAQTVPTGSGSREEPAASRSKMIVQNQNQIQTHNVEIENEFLKQTA